MIIGIAGQKQSGKTMAANRLEDAGFMRVSFASTMKIMARIMLRNMGLTDAEIIEADINKEAPLPIFGVSYRKMLQTLGTDWARSLNQDAWLHCAEKELQQLGRLNAVFDDVRFDNEADYIRDRGGLIIHLVRETRRHDDHASESGIVMKEGDAVVANNGSLDGLFDRVRLAIEKKFGQAA